MLHDSYITSSSSTKENMACHVSRYIHMIQVKKKQHVAAPPGGRLNRRVEEQPAFFTLQVAKGAECPRQRGWAVGRGGCCYWVVVTLCGNSGTMFGGPLDVHLHRGPVKDVRMACCHASAAVFSCCALTCAVAFVNKAPPDGVSVWIKLSRQMINSHTNDSLEGA